MKIAEINTVHYGSTGKIMLQIAQTARTHGHTVVTFSKRWKPHPQENPNHFYIGTFAENVLHRIGAPLTGREGFYSYWSTKRLLKQLDSLNPDILHLHNLHGWYLNYGLLFQYIKKTKVPVVWTLHDCWAFTGHCPYFTMVKCEKWKTGCGQCPQYRSYPQSWWDHSKAMWTWKKAWFTGVSDLTIVTPSQWLADLVKESFLREYPVKVIHNGIDLSVFQPTAGSFRVKYHCEGKYIILGVAFGWEKRKGLDVFYELSKRLDEKYQIVLVGTNKALDKDLPANIISIHKTQNQRELAEIYTAADLLVNPTREDNYPTVNLESLACGTPVLTFQTGGSPETVDDTCGSVVAWDDLNALERELIRVCTQKPYSAEACVAKAREFDRHNRFEEYWKLYEERYDSGVPV